jgi:microcystin degradation protein MlrC
MVTQSLDDAEGELLKRLRRITGPNVHYVAALDFHAIVTQDMVDHTQAMVAYQSYPHVDMAQTGERAANLMRRILAGETFFPEWRKLNFLVSMPWQSTLDGAPAGEIINYAHTLKTPDCPEIQFVPGFPLSDTPQSGPCVLAYSRAVESARLAVQKLAERIEISRGAFHGHLYTPANAVDYVHSHPEDRIILADTQDNPGGGAAGDSTEIARALLAGGVKNACVALVCDPDFAKAAHANGCSTRFRAPLGGKSHPGEQPLYESFQILALGDGKIVGTGPFYKGCHMELGPMVRVQTQGIDILVSSRKQQAADQAMFKHLGVSPSDYRVLALKSSVHFRADFAHLADQILMVKAIGANVADLHDLVFRRLRPGVEIL